MKLLEELYRARGVDGCIAGIDRLVDQQPNGHKVELPTLTNPGLGGSVE
jgi:hypothetical protein